MQRARAPRLADASLAIGGTLDHIDQGKLATARHRYHSALLIGERETAARASPLMCKHHALARRLRQREDDYLRYTTAAKHGIGMLDALTKAAAGSAWVPQTP